MGFLEALNERVLLGDGATGTLLYSYGIDFCFEQLNLTKPEQVEKVHRAYIESGSDVIQTNTYGANIPKLKRYGLEEQAVKINRAAVQNARNAAGNDHFVLGTIGGIWGMKKSAVTLEEIIESFEIQADALLQDEKIDGLLFETFYDFQELKTLVELARKKTKLPIVAQLAIHEVGTIQNGSPLAEGFKELEALGADVVGLNCRLGPHHIIKSFEEVPLLDRAFLSAYPNASLPEYQDGHFIFESDTQYFQDSALNLRAQGVRLIGGCCGTTPKHIEAMAKKVKGLPPVTSKEVVPKPKQPITVSKEIENEPLQDIVRNKRTVIVELDPPKTLDTASFFEGAKALEKAGIDALTMADNSLASPRVSNLAMASIVKQETNLRPLVHITCRDRNLIGLQSHILGLHTLGIHDVLAITGDPTKVGDFPGASSVYDLTSFDLIQLLKQCNEGVSFSGKPLKEKTSFSVAAAFNPNVRHLDRAVKRLEKKIEHGADYFISQPVYSAEQMIQVHEATKDIKTPIFIGVMPLVSSRNAEFLHNEVPGIKLSDEIRSIMAACGEDKKKAYEEGIAIAKNLIDAAFDLFDGIYLITPFMRYEMSVELTQYIHAKEQARNERKIYHG